MDMSKRGKRLIILGITLAVLLACVGGAWWYLKATKVDRQVRGLIKELKGNPPNWFERQLEKVGMKRKKPRGPWEGQASLDSF